MLKYTKIRRNFEFIEKINSIISPLGFIAGGFARHSVSKKETPYSASDIDVFCTTKESFFAIDAKLRENKFTWHKENEACVVFGLPKQIGKIKTLQLIKPRIEGNIMTVGEPSAILENFDFTITRAAIISNKRGLVDEDFHKDDAKNRLVIKNIHCPVSSLLRFGKYLKKGYTTTIREITKLFADWDKRPADYKARLFELIEKEFGDLTPEEFTELERHIRVD